ncbi:hypothetical protein GNI_068930 [Gregarina niphandrodes]|uniref:Uncharacterized protein n=1 Tax=Gregarina niphandrodes TaxID=110365 RepID=A0A023B7M6_GRENI|nr:hypothetical protein GNI_068930 [Gregarina niphandrodes]EZG67418.1 hypothetical protein GNI_068930 [Gregarina niphandrodes]|eukprot:XP_011130251.1 hypothetical protein GNI_068930 [Gregarina niphandrodes]
MDTSDWKQAVEQYELLELIAEFLNETENLPDAIPNSITQLLHASSNNGLIMISVPRNLEALRKFDITRERVDKLTNLMDRMRQQVLHHLQVALDARDQQTLVGCLMIMDNMGVLDYEIIRSLIIDDCLQLINECQTLEQCVAMIKPFSTAILKASAVKVAAQSLATIQCHEELQALRKIRQNMWKELAIKLSVSVKNVLEKSQSPTITSMAEFQIGLKRLSMAKELQNNLNLMGEPNSPRIQLRLAGTNTQLNNYITQVFIRHYRVLIPTAVNWQSTKLTVLEDSIHDARFELGCIPKSEGLKAIELLNEFVKVVEENHGASPLIEETIVTWLHLIDKINTDCISSGYSRSYLMNNIVKPSRLLSNRVARLD